MSEAETTRKRIDVAKPCCGRKRGHAPECKEAAPKADTIVEVATRAAVAQVKIVAPGFMGLFDALLDDIASRVVAKMRGDDGEYVVRPLNIPALEAEVAALGSDPTPVVEPKPAPAPAPVPDGRAWNTGIVVEPKPTVVEKGSADAAACDKAKPAKKEYVAPKPCTSCGKDENDAKSTHSGACEIAHPPEKKPEPPAFEVLREAAVEFAQKNSKEKLMDILEKYGAKGPEGVKLSLLPADKRAAFLAEVKP